MSRFGALDPVTALNCSRNFWRWPGAFLKPLFLVTHDVREALLLGHPCGAAGRRTHCR